MAGFADLMALSARQTQQSDVTTQTLLLDRRKKEEVKRREQEEKDRRDRELQAKLLQKQFEDERREREREQRAEEEQRRRELLVQKREEEQRRHLLYGPKKSKGEKAVREESRGRRHRDGSPDSEEPGPIALTREEKRQRKSNAALSRAFPSKRSSHSSGYSKAGRVLAGGAVDATSDRIVSSLDSSASSSQSVKQRIAAIPNVLTKLNVVKRDTRTIDEILQDRAKARETKVLDGDEARDFHDWFSKPKKDSITKKSLSAQPSPSPSPSRAITPNPTTSQVRSLSSVASSSAPSGKTPLPKISTVSPLSGADRKLLASRSVYGDAKLSVPSGSKGSVKKIPTSSLSRTNSASARESTSVTPRSSTSSAVALNGATRKRARSPSSSPPATSTKKRAVSVPGRSDISTEIWKLFGKDRDRYVRADVMSDDEDMEADAEDVRREELRSARLARKEDEEALEEERRYEEEKRRKKREKEARERRG